jgi:anti-sigma factor RsiW
MTCAETRRLLPAPDPQLGAAVTEHLADCAPCRAESDALKEVDRRLVRLGQIRTQGTAGALRRLDQRLSEQLGLLHSPRPSVPASRLAVAGALLLALLGILALAAFWIARLR